MTQISDMPNPVSATLKELTSSEDENMKFSLQALDKYLAAARIETVFSAPVVNGNFTTIMCSEVASGGGFGFGRGFGPVPPDAKPAPEAAGEPLSRGEVQNPVPTNAPLGGGTGMGGGGGASSRPLAVISIGPDGVRVQPIVDATKIGLAALTAFGMILATMLKIRRAAKKV